ncbi:energy transducer TonB [Reinekea thalattae]|uniref:Energy transducer TonB n=1 Tax=Reinekea thalattae TaxID=2593301 RepID=A0A5C8Z9E5_9GAMM|nr:energy transducer TonB [Reinekea thalattae]TXR54347.1 energy transducer TonB [Reinekea thalattae]
MNPADSTISAFDRLSFTIFIALAVHALIIFGVSFTSSHSSSKSPTLDVTLSLHAENKITQDEADFLSDKDQQGSGTLDQKALLKSTEEAEIEDNKIFQTSDLEQQITFAELSQRNSRIISTDSSAQNSTPTPSEASESNSQLTPNANQTQLNNITDVATLKAMLDSSRQEYANRPRVRTLTALSAKRAVDAAYIFHWLEKVERIGNQNYPIAARQNRLTGAVRLSVQINADGTLKSVTVSQSSGHALLDQAAKQIVYLAAPFEPLTAEMLQGMNTLEIIRTWHFRVDNRFEASRSDLLE